MISLIPNSGTAAKKMNEELLAADNMQEMFDILGKYYDLKNCRPGKITKGLLVTNLQKGVVMVGAKLKK